VLMALARSDCSRPTSVSGSAPAVGVESNVSWSCRQNAQPKPECHHGAMCAARREAGVAGFDCGAGCGTSIGVTPPAWWSRPYLIVNAREF
jgi:hypothetical protein